MFAVERHPPSARLRAVYRLGGVLALLCLILASGLPGPAGPSPAAGQDVMSAPGTDTREQRVTKRVAPGDTLPRLLMDLGVAPATKNRWLQAVAKQLGVTHLLKVGDTIHFHFIAPWNAPGLGQLTALRLERVGSNPWTWQLRHDQIVYHRDRRLRPVVTRAARPPAAARPVAKIPAKAVAKTPAKAVAPRPSPVERVTHVLRKGETLSRVFSAKGVSRRAAQPWIRAVSKRYSLKRLYPGRKIVLYFVTPSEGGGRNLRALQLESRGGDLLTWQWIDGRIQYRGRNHRVVVGQAAPAPVAARPPKPPSADNPRAAVAKPLPPTRSFEPLEKVIRTVRRGQTLGRILRPLGVSGKEGVAWFDAIDKQYPITRLKPGQRLHLYFERTPARHRRDNLKAVELEVKKGRKLTWERAGKKIRYGTGRVLTRGRATRDAAPVRSNGLSQAARKGSFLSEYALARIKQRNGLLEYTPPPNGTTNGKRPVPSLEKAERVTHKLKSGEYLGGVLRKYELNDKERRQWLAAIQRRNHRKHVRRLQTGSSINFYFKAHENGNGNGSAQSNGAGGLQALEIVLRSDLRLTWYRKEQDILFYKDGVPYQQEVRTVRKRG